jgi:hypothetical protein
MELGGGLVELHEDMCDYKGVAMVEMRGGIAKIVSTGSRTSWI